VHTFLFGIRCFAVQWVFLLIMDWSSSIEYFQAIWLVFTCLNIMESGVDRGPNHIIWQYKGIKAMTRKL
jgi:hypothetical protein